MNEIYINEVFSEYEKIYNNILSHIYPSKNSTGFPERNLSVNFSKAYEKIAGLNSENAFTWFEFQFGNSNNLHVDAIIINTDTQELYIIESKRFSNPDKKIREIGEDISRIINLFDELKNENNQRINMDRMKKVYGVILADVWLETTPKNEIYDSYDVGTKDPDSQITFLNKYIEPLKLATIPKNVQYFTSSIAAIDKYKLVSIMWELCGE